MQLAHALGHDLTAAAELLPACETGIIGALQARYSGEQEVIENG